jgi:hypothetical protein
MANRKKKRRKSEETPMDQLLHKLEVDPEEGLNSNEADARKKIYGPNEIDAQKSHPLLDFLSHFWGPIPWMIEASVMLSAVAGRWDMKRVLTIASVMSIGGVIETFILFWFILKQMGWEPEVVQTMIFLKLLVAGHLTIFLTRNTGWMWQKPYPNPLFLLAVEATQLVGTLFAVYGVLIHPIGWAKAGMVWAYAIMWLFLLNAVKVLKLKLYKRIDLSMMFHTY